MGRYAKEMMGRGDDGTVHLGDDGTRSDWRYSPVLSKIGVTRYAKPSNPDFLLL